jgi:SAM-dependent methyltransferase
MLLDEENLRAALARYPFYHVIPLTPSVSTPGRVWPNEALSSRLLSETDVRGKRVLDVGCRDGKFAFEAERLGAAEVVAIDNDLSRGAVEVVIPALKSRVHMEQLSVFDATPERLGRFDVVLCFGLIYHLRFPFWAFKLLRGVLVDDGLLLVETALVAMHEAVPLLYCPTGADSPYEDTSCTFFNRRGLCDSLASVGFEVSTAGDLRATGLMGWIERQRARFRAPTPASLRVYRAAFRCRKTQPDARVADYWEQTHSLHTVGFEPSRLQPR